jgi:hypothetical protein
MPLCEATVHPGNSFRRQTSRIRCNTGLAPRLQIPHHRVGLDLGGCGSTATNEGTGEYVDGSAITTEVKAVIFNDATPEGRRPKVARGVAGVKSVNNDMRIT